MIIAKMQYKKESANSNCYVNNNYESKLIVNKEDIFKDLE